MGDRSCAASRLPIFVILIIIIGLILAVIHYCVHIATLHTAWRAADRSEQLQLCSYCHCEGLLHARLVGDVRSVCVRCWADVLIVAVLGELLWPSVHSIELTRTQRHQ